MCRFLLVKSADPFQPAELLQKFAVMAKNSKTFDGDWQGDGWGISYVKQKHSASAHDIWAIKKSLKPIWEEQDSFAALPVSTVFVVHARSASFPQHKNIIEFNQPYIADRYAFVFNGLLKGVSLPSPVPGHIGAQKIWNILQEYLKSNTVEQSLKKVQEYLVAHTRFIQALNIGVSDGEHLYGLTYYNTHPEYYNLRVHNSESTYMISSEQLSGYEWSSLEPTRNPSGK